MAYRMVTEFGFSKRIGPFSYAGLPERERRLTEYPEVIAEARETVKDIERECDALLRASRVALERLTAALLDAETVSGEVVDACLAASGEPLDPNDRNAQSLPLAA
jgi:cell division protease FtsH